MHFNGSAVFEKPACCRAGDVQRSCCLRAGRANFRDYRKKISGDELALASASSKTISIASFYYGLLRSLASDLINAFILLPPNKGYRLSLCRGPAFVEQRK